MEKDIDPSPAGTPSARWPTRRAKDTREMVRDLLPRLSGISVDRSLVHDTAQLAAEIMYQYIAIELGVPGIGLAFSFIARTDELAMRIDQIGGMDLIDGSILKKAYDVFRTNADKFVEMAAGDSLT